MGKKTGQDILDNKKTFLPLKALELASPAQAEALRKIFTTECTLSDDEKIARALDLYNQLDIRRYTQDEIDNQFSIADEALESINLPAEKKATLKQLAQGLLGRQK